MWYFGSAYVVFWFAQYSNRHVLHTLFPDRVFVVKNGLFIEGISHTYPISWQEKDNAPPPTSTQISILKTSLLTQEAFWGPAENVSGKAPLVFRQAIFLVNRAFLVAEGWVKWRAKWGPSRRRMSSPPPRY